MAAHSLPQYNRIYCQIRIGRVGNVSGRYHSNDRRETLIL